MSKKIETIRYQCNFCNHSFPTEKEATHCEEMCKEMDKTFNSFYSFTYKGLVGQLIALGNPSCSGTSLKAAI